jgi:hypothetical protein
VYFLLIYLFPFLASTRNYSALNGSRIGNEQRLPAIPRIIAIGEAKIIIIFIYTKKKKKMKKKVNYKRLERSSLVFCFPYLFVIERK